MPLVLDLEDIRRFAEANQIGGKTIDRYLEMIKAFVVDGEGGAIRLAELMDETPEAIEALPHAQAYVKQLLAK